MVVTLRYDHVTIIVELRYTELLNLGKLNNLNLCVLRDTPVGKNSTMTSIHNNIRTGLFE